VQSPLAILISHPKTASSPEITLNYGFQTAIFKTMNIIKKAKIHLLLFHIIIVIKLKTQKISTVLQPFVWFVFRTVLSIGFSNIEVAKSYDFHGLLG
jgi:hypothetical protein